MTQLDRNIVDGLPYQLQASTDVKAIAQVLIDTSKLVDLCRADLATTFDRLKALEDSVARLQGQIEQVENKQRLRG